MRNKVSDLQSNLSHAAKQLLDRKFGALYEWPSDLPPVHVDRGLMHQVFKNLVKNGLEAMTDSGHISIEGMLDGEYLLVRIQDTGPGIQPDILERIFDPFFTTKGKKGTGLGLSVVRTIVEAHRGSIECQSAPQKGTTFVLCFPLR